MSQLSLSRNVACLTSTFFRGLIAPSGLRLPHRLVFEITLRHTPLGRTPLYKQSVRRKDLCLTTHIVHLREASTTPAGLEPAIPASEQPQTHALDGAATEIGINKHCRVKKNTFLKELNLKISRSNYVQR
jgi:hypothetical protein